ncbi:hypothetical protein BV914_01885 [Neisseria dumasiana]|nr:hypothetical protein BV914_01885 [Neisseria dumasiana]
MMRHFKGTLGVACLLFTQKQPEHDEECFGCLLAWGFAKVSGCVRLLPSERRFRCSIIGYLRRIKGGIERKTAEILCLGFG